jgi:hypothetical protein
VNRICLLYQVPLIVSFVGAHASSGYVVRAQQNDGGGCFQCFATLLEHKLLPQLATLASPDEAILEIGCNNPALPGAGFDIKTLALATTRKAVQTLLAEGSTYQDDSADIIFISNRATTGSLSDSLQVRKFSSQKDKHCEVCGQGT